MAEILQSAGSYDVLSSPESLTDSVLLIETAGRTCYQSEKNEVTMDTASKFIRRLIKSGHESVLEHSQLVVRFNNCSRGFTHELVRHRLAGFSQESTRYVDYANGEVDLSKFSISCVAPPHRDVDEKFILSDGRVFSFVDMCNYVEEFYRTLRSGGWKPEDARQILPTGLVAQIVVSANFREWRHIFKMRTATVAHWEIREVMTKLLHEINETIPAVFEDLSEVQIAKA